MFQIAPARRPIELGLAGLNHFFREGLMKIVIVFMSLILAGNVFEETQKLSSEEEIKSLKNRVDQLEKEKASDYSSLNVRKDKKYFGTIGIGNKFGNPGYNLSAGLFLNQ